MSLSKIINFVVVAAILLSNGSIVTSQGQWNTIEHMHNNVMLLSCHFVQVRTCTPEKGDPCFESTDNIIQSLILVLITWLAVCIP